MRAEAPVQGTFQHILSQRELLSQQSDSSSASPSETDDSESLDEGQLDQELSDEEGLFLDQPVFKGLFRPHLFKALLFKAKASMKLGTATSRPERSMAERDPADLFFSEPATEMEAIPAPPLFFDMIQRQWASLGTYSNTTIREEVLQHDP